MAQGDPQSGPQASGHRINGNLEQRTSPSRSISPTPTVGNGKLPRRMLGDRFREDEITDQARRDITAAGGTLELFDYPGDGHLFTDPTLLEEYDTETTELLWSRVLPFVGACPGQKL